MQKSSMNDCIFYANGTKRDYTGMTISFYLMFYAYFMQGGFFSKIMNLF